ncbi:MAG TPA: preprotein translocase subunit SecG [Burkholderiales bacterium]|jgi:preprotein translocase subunit SecG|nr:preprotein translocase subunit SecG [Burkholderiales bacterium]
MESWLNLVIALHVLVALGIIGLVLLQHGKGADMGSGFGGGASSSLFGATGSANFLSRTTAVLATVFFLTSLGLAYLASNQPRSTGGVLDAAKQESAAPKDGKAARKEGAKEAGKEPAKDAAKEPAKEPAKEAPKAAQSTKPSEVPK